MDTEPDDDKIKPVIDLSADPADFVFDDGDSAWDSAGSNWLTGFLGVDKTAGQDAATLCNLLVRLTGDDSNPSDREGGSIRGEWFS